MRMLVPVLIPLLCACNPALQNDMAMSDVVLSVAPVPAAPGDSVTLTLANELAEPIGYNLCTNTLERQDSDSWQPVPSDRICTMELRLLEPGQRATYTQQLEPGLPPGVYRFTTRVEHMEAGTSHAAYTEPFSVER